MGAQSSNIKPPQRLNQSIHGSIDIGVCGKDLKNGKMEPTRCSNNMSTNKSNEITNTISNLSMPNLPINTCMPIAPKVGIELKKDVNNIEKNGISKFKLSTCSHGYTYTSPNSIPKSLKVKDIKNQLIDMNKQKIMKIENTLIDMKNISQLQQNIQKSANDALKFRPF